MGRIPFNGLLAVFSKALSLKAEVEQMGRIPLNGLLAVFFEALSPQLARRRMLSKWGVYRLIRVLRLLNPPLKFFVAAFGAKAHVAKLGRIPMIPLLKTTRSISQILCWSSSHKGACCQSGAYTVESAS